MNWSLGAILLATDWAIRLAALAERHGSAAHALDLSELHAALGRRIEEKPAYAVQIAGLVARRIVCDVAAGDHVGLGDTYGLIRFGSRLDTYLPAGSEVIIENGQRALAGETVLARLP